MSRITHSPQFHFVAVIRFIRTLILFTYTDLKTILLPVSAFASITAPVSTPRNGIIAIIWIWTHLLECNLSNQSNSAVEDRINYPWRPIPANLISEKNARILRWTLVILCLCFSNVFGIPTLLASGLMMATLVIYNDFKFAGHWAAKNICSVSGYLCFEIGAVMIMGRDQRLDSIALQALTHSGLVILSTIQIQDFPDVEGDRALNRKTFPIVAPITSRISTTVMIIFWSLYAVATWGIGMLSSLVFVCLGFVVAWRIYFLRSMPEDRKSYVAYNVWLTMLHLLPANARWNVFNS